MTLYTTYEVTPDRPPFDGGAAGLGRTEAGLLDALFAADGATTDALGARLDAPRADVDRALGALGRLGLVEREGDAAWLTGVAFGLRRAVRRAGERVAVRLRDA